MSCQTSNFLRMPSATTYVRHVDVVVASHFVLADLNQHRAGRSNRQRLPKLTPQGLVASNDGRQFPDPLPGAPAR